jgi:hypothetical protein
MKVTTRVRSTHAMTLSARVADTAGTPMPTAQFSDGQQLAAGVAGGFGRLKNVLDELVA